MWKQILTLVVQHCIFNSFWNDSQINNTPPPPLGQSHPKYVQTCSDTTCRGGAVIEISWDVSYFLTDLSDKLKCKENEEWHLPVPSCQSKA